MLERGSGSRKPSSNAPDPTTNEEVTFLGGSPYQGLNNLTGCISNVFLRSSTDDLTVLDLLIAKLNVNVPLSCPAAKKPQQIVATQHKRKQKVNQRKPSRSRSRSTRESCQGELSHPESRATQFSGSTYSYETHNSVMVRSISHLSLEVKINSSDGCILYAAGKRHSGPAMLLSVSKGHLLLTVEAAAVKVKVRSLKRYDDEQWHPVFIKHEGNKISLTVGGISTRSKRMPEGGKMRITGPLFIGGVPASVKPTGCDGFIGCVRDLKLNAVPAGNPSYSQGVVPCFQNPLQPGVYFSGQGGHMEIDSSLVLGLDFEIQLEVRPTSDSGLVLHAGTSDQYLSLVLSQGEVIVSINSGKGEFSTSLIPEEPLCNRRWHKIRVVKINNILQLHVDETIEQSVGPKQSRSARVKATVHLGGAPSDIKVSSHPDGSPAFQGCFRHVSINHRSVMLSKPLSVRGAVGTQGCPHM